MGALFQRAWVAGVPKVCEHLNEARLLGAARSVKRGFP
jgi:hypothetical protein